MHGDRATQMWVWWGVGAVISFIAVAAAVFLVGMNPALLFGWAIGMIIAALLLIFRRAA